MPLSIAALSEYDAVALVNVPLRDLPPAGADLLPAYVRDLGHGLAMIGGDSSFGAGGYRDSPIEDALPVSMDIRPHEIEPPVAVVVVIDASGSMAAQEQGSSKIHLAAMGAARIAANLRDDDEITVIPFDHEPVGTIGPRPGRERNDVIAQLDHMMTASAGIAMYDALTEAARYLRASAKPVRHLITITDGDDTVEHGGSNGLGRSLAWTSDMKGQWGRDLMRWDGLPKLTAQLFGWLAPPPGSPRLSVETHASGDQLLLSASARDDMGQPVVGLHVTGELVDAAGGIHPVTLRAVSPGSYGTIVDSANAGTYQLRIVAYDDAGKPFATAGGGAVLPHGYEYSDNKDGAGLLASLAQITGGRENPALTALYDPAGVELNGAARACHTATLAGTGAIADGDCDPASLGNQATR
jgi:uncharacterized membrane protein